MGVKEKSTEVAVVSEEVFPDGASVVALVRLLFSIMVRDFHGTSRRFVL